jgi:hypothetical protein
MKSSKKHFAALVGALGLAFASSSFALPSLQLDINPGTYDNVTQTTVATTSQFTLRAFGQGVTLASPYYISMAVVDASGNAVGPANVGLGSFVFNGETIDVTGDMSFGNPPLEAAIAHDPGDLAPHGIFPTFFAERSFMFSAGNTIAAYNVQGDVPTAGSMFFADFAVDVANLATGYAIHFDLYSEEAGRCGAGTGSCADIDVDDFAPFSHDAQSGDPRVPPNEVPEPGSLALLGLGALAAARRARKS